MPNATRPHGDRGRQRSIPRPHSVQAWLATALGAVVVAGAAGVLFVYFVLFSHSAPAPLALTSPSSSATQAPALTSTGIPGSWTVAAKSVAGYRVHEQLAFLSAPSDAVGRTSQVTGSATISGSGTSLTVSAASFTVNVLSLTSDQQMRDHRLQAIGIESALFPHATFVMSSPATLSAAATTGVAIRVALTGALTIHGVTKPVTIPVQAKLSGSEIEVVGSIGFPWGEFGMQAPNIGGFVTVDATATMEFDLFLKHG